MSSRAQRIAQRSTTTPEGIRQIKPALPDAGMEVDPEIQIDPTQWRGLSRPMTDNQRQIFLMLVVDRRSVDYVANKLGVCKGTIYGQCSRIGLSLHQLNRPGMTSAEFLSKWFRHTLKVHVETVGELKIEPFADIAYFKTATTMRVEQRIEGPQGKGYNKASLERVFFLMEVRKLALMATALVMGINHNTVEELKAAALKRLTDEEKKKLMRLKEFVAPVEG